LPKTKYDGEINRYLARSQRLFGGAGVIIYVYRHTGMWMTIDNKMKAPFSNEQIDIVEDSSIFPVGHKCGEIPTRFITYAWGRKYVDDFLDYCLPALLAPGNIPALAEEFPTEFVFLTQEELFAHVRASPAWRRLEAVCETRLISIDDLIFNPDCYGMTLSYALYRGFEDLGPSMTERWQLFLNADFIPADGSLRGLARRMRAGAGRLIHAPSYCVNQEDVVPLLAAAREAGDGVIAIPPRKMADIIIRNRHNTIRGKTVNQPIFNVKYIDQLYRLVDENTVIGLQMPVALVAMMPERRIDEVRTYWDYGIVEDFCPTATPCVMGDSDEFLMLELRKSSTAEDQLRLGFPSAEEIADTLKGFMTDNPRGFGRFPLTLHSRDIPPETEEERAKLRSFYDEIMGFLPEALPRHENHPIWAYHYDRFHTNRRKVMEERAKRGRFAPCPEASAAAIVAETGRESGAAIVAETGPESGAATPLSPPRLSLPPSPGPWVTHEVSTAFDALWTSMTTAGESDVSRIVESLDTLASALGAAWRFRNDFLPGRTLPNDAGIEYLRWMDEFGEIADQIPRCRVGIQTRFQKLLDKIGLVPPRSLLAEGTRVESDAGAELRRIGHVLTNADHVLRTRKALLGAALDKAYEEMAEEIRQINLLIGRNVWNLQRKLDVDNFFSARHRRSPSRESLESKIKSMIGIAKPFHDFSWHYMHPLLAPFKSRLSKILSGNVQRALVIDSCIFSTAGALIPSNITVFDIPFNTVLEKRFDDFCPDPDDLVDFTVIDIAGIHLPQLGDAVSLAQRLTKPGGHILVNFLDIEGNRLPIDDPRTIRMMFPPFGPTEVDYFGDAKARQALSRVKRLHDHWSGPAISRRLLPILANLLLTRKYSESLTVHSNGNPSLLTRDCVGFVLEISCYKTLAS